MAVRALLILLLTATLAAVPAAASGRGRPVTLMTVRMLTSRAGWALSPYALLRTVDAGARWTPVHVPTHGATLQGATLAVRGDHLWLAAPLVTDHGIPLSAVLSSADGGRYWDVSGALRGIPIGMSWPSDRVGYLLTGEAGAAGNVPNDVYATSDGGRHWRLAAYNRLSTHSPAPLSSCDGFAGISFAARRVLVAAGGCGAGPRILLLYRSADGGRRWARESLPRPPGERGGFWNVTPPAFFGAHGVLPASVGPPDAFVLYRTDNGGLSWQPTTPIREPEPFATPDAFALSSLTVWAHVGTHLYLTTDGGSSWHRGAYLPFQTAPELDFLSVRMGFALGVGPGRRARNQLYRTTDGVHWHRVRTVAVP